MALLIQHVEEGEKSLRDYASPRSEDFDMQKSDSVLRATEYEINPQIIKMAAANPFRGDETDNPYRHIKWFTMICNTVQQDGVPLAWFRWNLFPYSLAEEARRWLALASFEVKGNWDDLMKKFCERFFPLNKVQHIRKQVINFAQGEKEGIDQGWDRFNGLIEQGPKLGFSGDVLLHTFYFGLFNEKPNLNATIIKLIMGDGRLIKPLGVLKNLNVAITGKDILTDFFVINASNEEHESKIFGKPFLKLVNAILDVGKGIVTFDLDGEKHTFKFHSKPSRASPLSLDNEGVESIRFIDSFRDPLQRALEDGDAQDDQDGELVETMEELKSQHGNLEEEKFEDIGELDQEEDCAPDVEMKPLPKGLKYEFLGDGKTFPVIVSDELSTEEMEKLLNLLKKHKKVIGCSINDLKVISTAFCTHRIQLEEQYNPVVEHQRRLSHSMRDVMKKEVIKLLNAGIIHPVPHSECVDPVHCVPKKGGLTVVKNEEQLIPQRTITGWRMCIDYRKLNKATRIIFH